MHVSFQREYDEQEKKNKKVEQEGWISTGGEGSTTDNLKRLVSITKLISATT